MLPRLREDARRLEEHAGEAEHGTHLHREAGGRAPALGAEAIRLLDAALGIEAIPAHVPFAERAVRARHRIRMAHDAGDRVADGKVGSLRRADHAAERLVTEDQALAAR